MWFLKALQPVKLLLVFSGTNQVQIIEVVECIRENTVESPLKEYVRVVRRHFTARKSPFGIVVKVALFDGDCACDTDIGKPP